MPPCTFRASIPFHPQRLYTWLETAIPGVVRAKGFFWIAAYPELALFFFQAGTQKAVELGGYRWRDNVIESNPIARYIVLPETVVRDSMDA